MSKGIKSSEFLLTVAACLVALGMYAASMFTGPKAALVLQVLGTAKFLLSTLGYTWSRTQVKKGAPVEVSEDPDLGFKP